MSGWLLALSLLLLGDNSDIRDAFDLWSANFQQAYAAAVDANQAMEAAEAVEKPAPKPAEPSDLGLRSLITEASNRFAVPEPWIRAVMRVESGGDAGVTAPKGAMGLMQVMPSTYAYRSDR